jgi:hypothetical protein
METGIVAERRETEKGDSSVQNGGVELVPWETPVLHELKLERTSGGPIMLMIEDLLDPLTTFLFSGSA